MSLASLHRNMFSSMIRRRGEDYFRNDQVGLLEANPQMASFQVIGNYKYVTRIEKTTPNKKTFHFHCTCPYFDDGFMCKHIWASVLTADKMALFAGKTMTEVSPIPEVPDFSWKSQILKAKLKQDPEQKTFRPPLQASFAIDFNGSVQRQKINLVFFVQEERRGEISSLRRRSLQQSEIPQFSDELDQELLWSLLGAGAQTESFTDAQASLTLSELHSDKILSAISEGKKLLFLRQKSLMPFAREVQQELKPYSYMQQIWNFHLALKKIDSSYFLFPQLRNGSETRSLQQILGFSGKYVFFEDSLVQSDVHIFKSWLEVFQKRKELEIPANEINEFLQIYFSEDHPHLELPEELNFEKVLITPQVRLTFTKSDRINGFHAQVHFMYGTQEVRRSMTSQMIYDLQKKLQYPRQKLSENKAYDLFLDMNPVPARQPEFDAFFSESAFLLAAEKAISLGWEVQASNKAVHNATDFKMHMAATGIDWFDLKADFKFGNLQMSLPDLLQNLRAGQRFFTLGDGSYGILPEAWMKRLSPLVSMGQVTETGLRLSPVQALFLGSALADDENLTADKKFRNLQQLVQDLRRTTSLQPPPSFKGVLRPYQQEGLAWLHLLSQNQIGGLLADDMGLGKTVQILSLLCFDFNSSKKPSLIVAPKSLVFNWINEARRFTPDLKILDHTGINRTTDTKGFKDYDIVITTYHTLRMDIDIFKNFQFNFFVIDEAHYIKNPQSQSFMACRLIQAHRKMALTGTPVENALSDLLSILDVITPGLLSSSQRKHWSREKDLDALRDLSKAFRPFILRRTKEEVLKDLPPKQEQLLFCELSEGERKKYDELKSHYWTQLSGKIKEKGLQKSKIEVLEALLRLRQASCHQGLLDKTKKNLLSSKFQLLVEQIESVIQDGHKALVFSQFTQLLGLLKSHLDQKKIPYEYLDGKTVDRQERIQNFQSNSDIKLFLLSLKAGGVGLNLTAADYVFILDPWWNPAAEDQAIDRTHRIGQTRTVFAYKLIAKDTVEEKILELQKSKKALAKAVISNDKSVLSELKLEDLEALFT